MIEDNIFEGLTYWLYILSLFDFTFLLQKQIFVNLNGY